MCLEHLCISEYQTTTLNQALIAGQHRLRCPYKERHPLL
jgi:hypothetical protein